MKEVGGIITENVRPKPKNSHRKLRLLHPPTSAPAAGTPACALLLLGAALPRRHEGRDGMSTENVRKPKNPHRELRACMRPRRLQRIHRRRWHARMLTCATWHA
jgi:hypothetical protein